MNEDLKWGTRVRIGGHTMLRPGFSLVGLEGIIVPSAPNAPPGCCTVAVDWQGAGYTSQSGYDPQNLPLFVNVPQEHVELVAEEEEPQRPALSIVRDEESEAPPPPTLPFESDDSGEVDTPDEPPPADDRPKLRLI